MQLDEYQQEAVTAPIQDIRVLAGAGSGKTRVIVERMAYLADQGIPPSEILAITYTRKAALEMRERLEARLGKRARRIFTGTIHSWCLTQLFRFGERTGWNTDNLSTLDDQQAELVMNFVLEDLGYRKKGKLKGVRKKDISEALRSMAMPEEESLRAIMESFYHACREANVMTYSMILKEAARLLGDNEVLEILQREYRHLVLDEAQDTIPAQWLIMDLLDPKTRFIVGDSRQSIFGFAGAGLEVFSRNTGNCNPVFLAYNYRSCSGIVKEGNRVAENSPAMLAYNTSRGSISVVPATSGDIPGLIETCLRDFPPGEIAVLCRLHRPLSKAVGALQEAGIAVHYPGGARQMDLHPDKQVIHSCFSLTTNPWDVFAFRHIAGFLGYDPVRVQAIRTRAAAEKKPVLHAWNADLGRNCRDDPVIPLESLDPDAAGQVEEDIAPFLREMPWHEAVGRYLRWFATKDMQSGLESPPEDHVQALSIHQAKGLEWQCVIVLGMSEGILPSSRAGSAEDLAEEKRLYYVAATRAVDRLILCPRPEEEPSRFLEGVKWQPG